MAKAAKSGPMPQEQVFVLFWWLGLTVIGAKFFGTLVTLVVTAGAVLISPWLIVNGAEFSHERCGQKGYSSLSVMAAACFGIAALCSPGWLEAILVTAGCAVYYVFQLRKGSSE
jgi:hypothetical protein